MLFFHKWFCCHKWEKLEEKTTESKFEHAMKVSGFSEFGEFRIPHQMCYADRKHIQIFICKECGKLKRYVTEI